MYMYKPDHYLYTFHKRCVPDNPGEKVDFAEKLAKFGISLQQYKSTLEMPNITM